MQFAAEQLSQLQPRPSATATFWFGRKESIYHAREPRSYMILAGGISCTPSSNSSKPAATKYILVAGVTIDVFTEGKHAGKKGKFQDFDTRQL